MLKSFTHAVLVALRAFRADWEASSLQASIRSPRPLWDNGTDYDVPTFLRRRAG